MVDRTDTGANSCVHVAKPNSVKCCDVTALVAIGNYQNNMASI